MLFTRSLACTITRSKKQYQFTPHFLWKVNRQHSSTVNRKIKTPKGIRPKLLSLKSFPENPSIDLRSLAKKKNGEKNPELPKSFRDTPLGKTIFQDGTLKQYIKNNIQDPWIDTVFKGYVHMDPKQKGDFGEQVVSRYLGNLGFTVEERNEYGHDRIVNGLRTEIKFSLAQKNPKGGIFPNRFVLNHISCKKEWDRLLFMGINGENKIQVVWFKKTDFSQYVNEVKQDEGCVFRKQQGGRLGKNDDFMCNSTNFIRLMNLPFVHVGIQDFC
jgi:hypothetical protein